MEAPPSSFLSTMRVGDHVTSAHIKRRRIAKHAVMGNGLICAGYFFKLHGNATAPHM